MAIRPRHTVPLSTISFVSVVLLFGPMCRRSMRSNAPGAVPRDRNAASLSALIPLSGSSHVTSTRKGHEVTAATALGASVLWPIRLVAMTAACTKGGDASSIAAALVTFLQRAGMVPSVLASVHASSCTQ